MTTTAVLGRVLRYGGILAIAIAVVGAPIGYLVAGGSGVVSALIGTAMAVVFLAITAVSVLVAARFSIVAFFGIVMGAWLLKFVLFLALVFTLRDQPWVQTMVLFVSIVAGVVGTLIVDVIVIAQSRIPYVNVELPGHPSDIRKPR